MSAATDGSAHGEAHDLFSATGRSVINRSAAPFEFNAQGLITRHLDRFDFWAWSRQALDAPGWLLGSTPSLRAKGRRTAAAKLQRFLAAG